MVKSNELITTLCSRFGKPVNRNQKQNLQFPIQDNNTSDKDSQMASCFESIQNVTFVLSFLQLMRLHSKCNIVIFVGIATEVKHYGFMLIYDAFPKAGVPQIFHTNCFCSWCKWFVSDKFTRETPLKIYCYYHVMDVTYMFTITIDF